MDESNFMEMLQLQKEFGDPGANWWKKDEMRWCCTGIAVHCWSLGYELIDLYQAYLRKNKINRERQQNGY